MVLIFASQTLDVSELDMADAMPSLVSSGFLHLVGTIYDTFKPQLAPGIKCHTLWCQARTLLLPVPQAGKMLASELIHYFSSHPAAFGFWASLPPDMFTLNPANKKNDHICQIFRLALVHLLMALQIQQFYFSYQNCTW